MVTVGFGNWEIIADILLGMEFCQWCVDDEMDSLVCDTIISVVFLFYVTVRSYVVFFFFIFYFLLSLFQSLFYLPLFHIGSQHSHPEVLLPEAPGL